MMSEAKYAIIAQHEDNFVVSTLDGYAFACGEQSIDLYREREQLIMVDAVFDHMLETAHYQTEILALDQDPVADFITRVQRLFYSAHVMLGRPSKDQVNFYSVPDDIVDALNW
jgi:hypothetical protein